MRHIATLILGCAAGLLATASTARGGDATIARGLVRNAWYWQARARAEKAEEAWKAVLAADPDQPDALAAVGGLDARAGRLPQARSALEHLRRVAPGHPDVAALQREIELGPRLGAMLASARKLVHEGRVDDGIARYREIFGRAGPPGDLALEYLETLGGTPAGWAEARDGLQRLVARAPEETRFRLALAKLLTYQGPTRAEGIGMLAALSRDPAVAGEATASWRKALLWLGGAAADVPLLKPYVDAHPRDAAVARKLEAARGSGTVAEGFAALERGDTAEAGRRFAAAGDGPDARRGRAIVRHRELDARRKAGFDALDRGDVATAARLFEGSGDDDATRVGRALVAQRRAAEAQRDGEYGRAHALLEIAKELAPRRPDVWEAGLASVEFWLRMDEGRTAQREKRYDAAEQKLREALDRAPPSERWNAELALADVALARGDRDRADRLYRSVLERMPRQPDALRGVTTLLVQAGRFDEAIPMNDALREASPDQAFRPGWLRAEAGRARAARSVASRALAAARAELEAARRQDPGDAWVLHDLANVLLESGDTSAAEPVVAALLEAAPRMPEARLVEGRLLAAQGDGARALAVLSKLPESVRDRGVSGLQRRLEVQVRVPEIVARARRGAHAAAVRDLLALEPRAEADPALAGAIARAWVDIGEPGRAAGLARRTVAASPRETRTLRLEVASALFRAGDEAGASALLAGLEREPGLSAQESRWLADLRISQAVRGADARRAAGDPTSAHAALEPVLRDYPEDARVLAAGGRLLERDDPRRAHGTYVRALAIDPQNADARRGAVDTALAVGDREEARRLAADGLERAPHDPRMHVLVARAAVQSGDDRAAMQALHEARTLATAAGGDRVAGPAAADATATGAGPELGAEIGRELERVQDRHRSGIGGEGTVRVRRGEGGLSALTELGQTASAELAIGYGGRATFGASLVELDAGTLASSASDRFGSAGGGPPGALRAQGTALSVGYEGRLLAADAGTAALGFPLQSWVGGVQLRDAFGPLHLAVAGARRSVTDSMLSYAGVRDPATGRVWGGVVAQGGRVDVDLVFSRSRYYARGAYDWLVGQGVAENGRATAGLGVEATLGEGAWGAFTLGLDAFGMRYDRNLRYFTLGHGGYFSPQRFARGSLPVGWRRVGTLRWELVAAPGFEWFEEAPSAAFPAASGASPPDLPDLPAYPGQRVRGFALDGHALLGWAFASGFELRATAALQAAPEYRELSAGIALQYGSVGSAR